MICIIDYGAGNLTSVKNILKKVGAYDVVISNKIEDIHRADKLILPGVGKFDFGMQQLIDSGLIEALNREVIENRKPLLGICLGAQLITNGSEEGELNGLGWVAGKAISFKNRLPKGMKIPHMGWNTVQVKNNNILFNDMPKNSRFYFVHSFYLEMENDADIWLSVDYGINFCAAFNVDNIYACQFHPEKSHKFGMKLMENFIALK